MEIPGKSIGKPTSAASRMGSKICVSFTLLRSSSKSLKLNDGCRMTYHNIYICMYVDRCVNHTTLYDIISLKTTLK